MQKCARIYMYDSHTQKRNYYSDVLGILSSAGNVENRLLRRTAFLPIPRSLCAENVRLTRVIKIWRTRQNTDT